MGWGIRSSPGSVLARSAVVARTCIFAQIANAASPASIPEVMSSNLFFRDIKDYSRRCADSSAVTGITSFTLFAAVHRGFLKDLADIHRRARWVTLRTRASAATTALAVRGGLRI